MPKPNINIFSNILPLDKPILREGNTVEGALLLDYTKSGANSYLCKFKMIIPKLSGKNSMELLHGYSFIASNEEYVQTSSPHLIDLFVYVIETIIETVNNGGAKINLDKQGIRKMVQAVLGAVQN